MRVRRRKLRVRNAPTGPRGWHAQNGLAGRLPADRKAPGSGPPLRTPTTPSGRCRSTRRRSWPSGSCWLLQHLGARYPGSCRPSPAPGLGSFVALSDAAGPDVAAYTYAPNGGPPPSPLLIAEPIADDEYYIIADVAGCTASPTRPPTGHCDRANVGSEALIMISQPSGWARSGLRGP